MSNFIQSKRKKTHLIKLGLSMVPLLGHHAGSRLRFSEAPAQDQKRTVSQFQTSLKLSISHRVTSDRPDANANTIWKHTRNWRATILNSSVPIQRGFQLQAPPAALPGTLFIFALLLPVLAIDTLCGIHHTVEYSVCLSISLGMAESLAGTWKCFISTC